jgi:hypothetical protein
MPIWKNRHIRIGERGPCRQPSLLCSSRMGVNGSVRTAFAHGRNIFGILAVPARADTDFKRRFATRGRIPTRRAASPRRPQETPAGTQWPPNPDDPEIREAVAMRHFPRHGEPQPSNRARISPIGIDRPSRPGPASLEAHSTTRRRYNFHFAIAAAPRDLIGVDRSSLRLPLGETVFPGGPAPRSNSAFPQSPAAHIPPRVFLRAARCESMNDCQSNGLPSEP